MFNDTHISAQQYTKTAHPVISVTYTADARLPVSLADLFVAAHEAARQKQNTQRQTLAVAVVSAATERIFKAKPPVDSIQSAEDSHVCHAVVFCE